jgi:hypothetical protein
MFAYSQSSFDWASAWTAAWLKEMSQFLRASLVISPNLLMKGAPEAL